MRRRLKFVILSGLAVFALAAVSLQPVGAGDADIKQLMGENIGRMQALLVDLINGRYAAVPREVAAIEKHAAFLSKNVPPRAKRNKELFLSMAYNLRIQAKNLQLVTRALLENEQRANIEGLLKVDYLRTTAAAHFGSIVTACVACHNQFRRGPVH